MHGSSRVGAVLTAWYPGQGAATIPSILFGQVSPSGGWRRAMHAPSMPLPAGALAAPTPLRVHQPQGAGRGLPSRPVSHTGYHKYTHV